MATTPIKLLIQDGGRHRLPSGYGKFARSLIIGLSAHPAFSVSITPATHGWAVDEWYQQAIRDLPVSARHSDADVILQLGNPRACRPMPRPTAMLACVDVSDMTEEEARHLANADMLLATTTENEAAFRRRFPTVRLCHGGLTEHLFRPQKRFRAEGEKVFSMIFVGAFGYRKGIDLLLRAFGEEFTADEAHLTVHMPEDGGERAANYINQAIVELGRPMRLTLSTKALSEAWMSRLYNRHDAFVTMTRGEGWGLPIIEAMLCGLPVIAPFSTAMRDYMNDDVAACVPTRSIPLAEITDPFAANFVRAHAGEGVCLAEPDIAEARRQMRRLAEDPELREAMGARARAHILQNFSEKRFVAAVADALIELANNPALSRHGAKPPAITVDAPAPAAQPAGASAPSAAPAKVEAAEGEKLEIGAGNKPMAGYIHHDIRPLPDIEVVCDARSFPPEHKGRYAEVYAANIIEHFNRFEVFDVLDEWISLLRPGGIIKLITPDSREIARQLTQGFISMEWFAYLTYGGQDYEFNKHYYAFDADSLAEQLQERGLEIVKKKPGIRWEDRKRDRYCPMIEVWARKPG